MRAVSLVWLLAIGCTYEEAIGPVEVPVLDPTVAPIEEPRPAEPGVIPTQDLGTVDLGAPVAVFAFGWLADLPVANVRGMEIAEDGFWAHAGMGSFACDVVTNTGVLDTDYDVPGDEDVVDVGVSPIPGDGGLEVFLLTTGGGLHVHPVGSGQTSASYRVDGVHEARLVDDGYVASQYTGGECLVSWLDAEGETTASVTVPDGRCDGEMAAMRDGSRVWIAESFGVVEVTPAGWRVVDGAADAALDFDGERLFVGADHAVRALGLDDQVLWEAALASPVRAVEASPHHGTVLVGDDAFAVSMLHATDAAWLGAFEVGSQIDAVRISADGSRIAVVQALETDFYQVVGGLTP